MLRPLAALIIGTFVASNVPLFLCLAALCLVLSLLLWLQRKPPYASVARSLMLSLLFVVIGIASVKVGERSQPEPFPADRAIYECRLTGDAYFKGKTYRCHVDVLGRMDSVSVGSGAKAILYLADTAAHAGLLAGDRIYVRTSMSMPDFNEGYRDYLLRNNVCGTGYVAPGELCVAGHDAPSGLLAFSRNCQRAVNAWFSDIGFRGDELAVLSALTVGLRDDISDELNEDYSISGLAHVLSLSGLHVGLIFFVLQFLLRPLTRFRGGGAVSWIILTAALFAFAVLTGLSSPVIRACFMMSAFGFTTLTRRGTSLNALCLVALVMLVIDYRYVYDVSFQMSFTAVFFILVFYGRLSSLVVVRNRALRYVKDTFVLSFVAQAGVVPIIAYTFGTFSLYGVISSVIVVPFLSLLMYAAVVMILLFWLPFVTPCLVFVVDSGLKALNWSASFFGGLPFAGISLSFDLVDVFFCYAAIVVFFYWLQVRTPSRFRLLMLIVMLWTCYGVFMQWRQWRAREVVFENTLQGTSCRFVEGFDRLDFVIPLTDSTLVHDEAHWQSGQVAMFHGVTVMRVDTAFYDVGHTDKRMPVDYAWLCRGARGHLDELSHAFDIGNVVIDANLSSYYRNRYLSEADSLGLPVVDMSRLTRHVIDLRR